MTADPVLYLWFDREPGTVPADQTIVDVPGTADIDLLSSAILTGELGEILPARIHMSPLENPAGQSKVRSVDVGRLLRDLGIQHRRCYRIILPDSSD